MLKQCSLVIAMSIGCASAVQAQSSNFPTLRSKGIEMSYNEAFCRVADPAEVKSWEARNMTAANLRDAAPYVAAHRNWLKSNAEERRATVIRAYLIEVGQPTPEEIAHWDNRVKASGETCEEMKAAHRAYFKGKRRPGALPFTYKQDGPR